MRRPQEIAHEENSMKTLVQLTGAFEGIASMRVAQTKRQVLESTIFFNKLWSIYRQIRVDALFSITRKKSGDLINKELFIIITAEGGFSGDIDQKLVKMMLKEYDPDKNDIIVIGRHGATQLYQRSIPFKRYYKLPVKDRNINVTPIIQEVQLYNKCVVFYQEYVTLISQEVRRIELAAAVQIAGSKSEKNADLITDKTYIFEPSSFAVVAHLERSMLNIALSQLILQSKLAQYASRFKAMNLAHQRADETRRELHTAYNRSRRVVKDERLKEIANGLKKSEAGLERVSV